MLEDDQLSGRPVTTRNEEKVKRIENALAENCRMSICWLSESLGINCETVCLIITEDVGMQKLCSRILPKSLSADNNLMRVQVCKDWIQKCVDDPSFLDHVVTGDKSWFYEYDPADKQANKAWLKKSEPNLKTPRRLRSKIKSMLILFFDRRGIIHHKFFRPTPKARGINGERYLAILKRLRARITCVKPETFEEDSWVLHQDNAPPHNCTLVSEWLARNRTIVIQHCPWFPDLVPNDF